MSDATLQPKARELCEQLHAVRLHHEAIAAHIERAPKLQVAGVGQSITAAYEHLRNAAENAEEHLLRQRAIRRFFARSLSLHVRTAPVGVGEELVVELTQAGYLANGTIALATVDAIEKAAGYRHTLFWQLRDANVPHAQAELWVLDGLSVEIEELLGNDHMAQNALAYFAHNHYRDILKGMITLGQEYAFDLALYMAIHQSLLRSDASTIRQQVLKLYLRGRPTVLDLIEMNRRIDNVYSSDLMTRLNRAVIKYGAPLKILKEMIADTESVDILLRDRSKFMSAYEMQMQNVYDNTAQRLQRGIIKSVIFLLITKVIIGLAIEIPYDLIFHGFVVWLPLAINILFPPLYMASLRWSFKLPGTDNKRATAQYIDKLLYGTGAGDKTISIKRRSSSTIMSIVYATMFVVSFSVVVLALSLLDFNIVQGIIFFIFLSTASFLGFRLSRMVRELEMFATRQNFFDAVRDFFYTPFVIVGRWISDKYSHVNIITIILDMAIELPLKTILRMTRQWVRFLNDKRDEM